MVKTFYTALITSLFLFNNLNAQDYKKLKFRVFGGSEFDFLITHKSYKSRGVKVGFSAGLDANYYLGCKTAFFTGLGYNYTPFDYWLSSSDYFNYSTNHSHMISIPVGIKFKTKDNANLSAFFVNLAYTNNIVFESNHQDYKVNIHPTEFETRKREGTYIVYNPGATAEFGIENRFNQKNLLSTSLYFRSIYHNFFSSIENDRLLLGGLGFRLGYFF